MTCSASPCAQLIGRQTPLQVILATIKVSSITSHNCAHIQILEQLDQAARSIAHCTYVRASARRSRLDLAPARSLRARWRGAQAEAKDVM